MSGFAVENRILRINAAIKSLLHSDLQTCFYFSVALNECCVVKDKPQCWDKIRLQVCVFTLKHVKS